MRSVACMCAYTFTNATLYFQVGVMPLGEALGRALPRRVKVGTLLALVFCLGCVCTLAEPAVSALQVGLMISTLPSSHVLFFSLAIIQFRISCVSWVSSPRSPSLHIHNNTNQSPVLYTLCNYLHLY